VRAPHRWSQEEVEVLSIVVSSFAQGFERRLIDARLERMAYEDPLTGLPNRTLLGIRLAQALESCRNHGCLLAVGYLDLDAFKPINDRYGHAAGDRLLVEAGRRLSACVRLGDTVGRLGGDEFVVILPDLQDQAELEVMSRALLAAIAEPFRLADDIEVRLSTSLGLRLVPPDDVDPDTLLRQADQAMYSAKRAGQGLLHHFDVEMERQHEQRCVQVRRIAAAISAGEMRLHVQPVVNLRSGQVCSLEALVRWAHPERGLLLPGEWLPCIEDTDTIAELGEWVMEQSLRHASRWLAAGLCMGISINVSPRELLNPAFPQRLGEQLSCQPDLPRQAVRLEVLETAALRDFDRVARAMEACRDLGVSFALDDFGTGHSSLAYLRRLPVSAIKIDGSFVRHMLQQPADAAIVRGVIDLASAFGLQCVAEGAETHRHLEQLQLLGCDLAQGLGVAAAMPADSFAAWGRWRLRGAQA
jgi:diguanylate cyclase (GGDEF)-like protein